MGPYFGGLGYSRGRGVRFESVASDARAALSRKCATFVAVAAPGLVACIGRLLFVPRKLAHEEPASLQQQMAVLRQPRLLLVYAMTAEGYGGTFVAFTCLAPMLQQTTGLQASALGLLMLAYGDSVAVGNIRGGKLADRKGPIGALKLIVSLLAMVLLLLTFSASNPWLMVLTVLGWGAVAFGNVAGLQVYVVQQAERFAPRAVDVVAGLNIAAFNVGIALGAWGASGSSKAFRSSKKRRSDSLMRPSASHTPMRLVGTHYGPRVIHAWCALAHCRQGRFERFAG